MRRHILFTKAQSASDDSIRTMHVRSAGEHTWLSEYKVTELWRKARTIYRRVTHETWSASNEAKFKIKHLHPAIGWNIRPGQHQMEGNTETKRVQAVNEQSTQIRSASDEGIMETKHIRPAGKQSVQCGQRERKRVWNRSTHQLWKSKASDSVGIRWERHWNKIRTVCGRATCETWSVSNEARFEAKHVRPANEQGIRLGQHRIKGALK